MGQPAFGRRAALLGLGAAAALRPASGSAQPVGIGHVDVLMKREVEAFFPATPRTAFGTLGFTVTPLLPPPAGTWLRDRVPAPSDPVWARLAALGFGAPPRPSTAANPAWLAWVAKVEAVRFANVSHAMPVELLELAAQELLAPRQGRAAPAPAPAAALGEPAETSLSWGGAYVRTLQPGRITAVQGAWTIPEAWVPPGATGDFRTSQWLGLDGCDTASWTMPQMGTMRAFGARDGAQHRLWWQWWVKGARLDLAHQILGIPVVQGTRVEATVSVPPQPAGQPWRQVMFRLLVTEPAPGDPRPILLMFSVRMEAPRGLPVPANLGVEGRIAEWIVERPRRYVDRQSGWLYELPGFKPVTFEGCAAQTNQAARLTLERARLLRIVDWEAARPGVGLTSVRRLDKARVMVSEG